MHLFCLFVDAEEESADCLMVTVLKGNEKLWDVRRCAIGHAKQFVVLKDQRKLGLSTRVELVEATKNPLLPSILLESGDFYMRWTSEKPQRRY